MCVLHLDAIKSQNHSSGGLDLALGIPLFVVGALLATNHLRIHRRRPNHPPKKPPSKLESWMTRALHEPRYGRAVIIGLAVGIPGVSYLLALHHLVASKTPATIAVVSVLVFTIINFAPVIVPFVFVRVRPGRTEKAIGRVKDWTVSHERLIAAVISLLAGAYMVISGTLRLLS